jgi:hypothetical protein
MPILNYTTVVPPDRSIGEITSLLIRKGARSITQDFYDDGRVKAVSFVMAVGGIPTRFVLPANAAGVAGVMMAEKPFNSSRSKVTREQYRQKMMAQAEWVAWRIMKDWVSAQMALIESGQAHAAQVFLPYATEASGRTIYELFVENNQKQLPAEASSE